MHCDRRVAKWHKPWKNSSGPQLGSDDWQVEDTPALNKCRLFHPKPGKCDRRGECMSQTLPTDVGFIVFIKVFLQSRVCACVCVYACMHFVCEQFDCLYVYVNVNAVVKLELHLRTQSMKMSTTSSWIRLSLHTFRSSVKEEEKEDDDEDEEDE